MGMTIPLPRDPSDDDIARLSRENPGWHIEVTPDGALQVSPPIGTAGSPREVEAAAQLRAWARAGAGGKVFSSSTGFRLPDGSLRSPDAAWIGAERLAALGEDGRAPRFWRVCPEVAIEILSETDDWSALVAKLDAYVAQGARYALGIDPFERRIATCGAPPPGLVFDVDAIVDA